MDLQPKTGPNSVLKRSEWNAVVERLGLAGTTPYGTTGIGIRGTRKVPSPYQAEIIAESPDEEIPPWSVFGLDSSDEKTTPVRIVIVNAFVENASVLFTNGNILIPQGGSGQVFVIGDFQPVRLHIEEGHDPPEVGKCCGPAITDGSVVDVTTFGISREGSGLLCLVLDPDGEHAVCIRRPVGTFIGKTDDYGVTGFDDTDDEDEPLEEVIPGTGNVTIYAWTADDKLFSTDYTVPVFSLSTGANANAWVLLIEVDGRIMVVEGSGSGGQRLFMATLTDDMNADHAVGFVTDVQSLTPEEAPTFTTVENRHQRAALEGDEVTVVEDTSDPENTVYYVIDVDRHDCGGG